MHQHPISHEEAVEDVPYFAHVGGKRGRLLLKDENEQIELLGCLIGGGFFAENGVCLFVVCYFTFIIYYLFYYMLLLFLLMLPFW